MKEYDSTTDTLKHINRVSYLLGNVNKELIDRARNHDLTKLEDPEKALFDEYTPKLVHCTYGSEEYKDYLNELSVALDHHYSEYSHHPEHVFTQEEWRDVIGYDGTYIVSSTGRIKRVDKVGNRNVKDSFVKSGYEMSSHVTPKGYERIRLQKNKIGKNHFVHTIVANAFIGSPPTTRHQVNHKDGNKLNNCPYNLEYVTPSANLIHAYRTQLRKASVKYIVKCEELGILSIGMDSMAKKVRDAGYPNVNTSGIWRCITSDSDRSISHYDLHFTSHTIDEFRTLHSPLNGMNLFDLIEMTVDWIASSERHADGDIRKSIQLNKDRFLMSDELVCLLNNTARYIQNGFNR